MGRDAGVGLEGLGLEVQRHQVQALPGAVAVTGIRFLMRGMNLSCNASDRSIRAMRGSGPRTVEGGGHGWFDSNQRSDRTSGS